MEETIASLQSFLSLFLHYRPGVVGSCLGVCGVLLQPPLLQRPNLGLGCLLVRA